MMIHITALIMDFTTEHKELSMLLIKTCYIGLGIIAVRIIRTRNTFTHILRNSLGTSYFYALLFLSLLLFNILLKINSIGKIIMSIGIYNAAGMFGAFAETIWRNISSEQFQVQVLKVVKNVVTALILRHDIPTKTSDDDNTKGDVNDN